MVLLTFAEPADSTVPISYCPANRIRPHPKVFVHPTPMLDALRFIDALLAAPGV